MSAAQIKSKKDHCFRFIQLSDCHLFSEPNGLHFGANVYQNLCDILRLIKLERDINAIVFTGDLTQDHTEESYQLFAEAVYQSGIDRDFYFLAGNHDEHKFLNKYLNKSPFRPDKNFGNSQWQINILNSKSETPAGYVSKQELKQLKHLEGVHKHQLVIMHHHPIDVGYFIDKHGLNNQDEFWQTINQLEKIRAVLCGHVHQALELSPEVSSHKVKLFTCPATSIQFDINSQSIAANSQSAGYRIFTLYDDGEIESSVKYL